MHTPRRSTPPAADDRAGRPGVGSASTSTASRPRPQRQKGRGEDAGSPIFTWWPWRAPAQKSNSLRQRPQNVALEAAQVLLCLYPPPCRRWRQKKKKRLDRSLNGRHINRPGEPDIVHAHNAGYRPGRIIQIYVVLIIVSAIAVCIVVSDPHRI